MAIFVNNLYPTKSVQAVRMNENFQVPIRLHVPKPHDGQNADGSLANRQGDPSKTALKSTMRCALLAAFANRSELSRPQKLCFIDMDGTLVQRTLAIRFGRWLAQNRHLSKSKLGIAAALWGAHKLGLVSFSTLLKRLCDEYLKNREAHSIALQVRTFLKQQPLNIYNERVVAFLDDIRPNALCILSSRSPDFLVTEVAQTFGFDAWQASTCNGSEQHVIDGNEKRRLCMRVASELSLDCNEIIALGNTEDDCPLLECARRSIAVNPSATLRKQAQERSWEIWCV